jgi:hypothetical protein
MYTRLDKKDDLLDNIKIVKQHITKLMRALNHDFSDKGKVETFFMHFSNKDLVAENVEKQLKQLNELIGDFQNSLNLFNNSKSPLTKPKLADMNSELEVLSLHLIRASVKFELSTHKQSAKWGKDFKEFRDEIFPSQTPKKKHHL